MSTRCVVTFQDDDGSHSVYKHSDGYPDTEHGILALIEKTKAHAWELPRFEADDFAASFVVAAKQGAGGVRLTTGPEAHGDLEYTYLVTCVDGKLGVEVNRV